MILLILFVNCLDFSETAQMKNKMYLYFHLRLVQSSDIEWTVRAHYQVLEFVSMALDIRFGWFHDRCDYYLLIVV